MRIQSLGLVGRLLLVFTWMAGIAFLSLLPGTDQAGDSDFVWIVDLTPKLLQKLMHVLLYGAMTALWLWALARLAWAGWIRSSTAVAIPLVFGVAMEWAQLSVPGRYGTMTDVALNGIGVAAGAVAAIAGFRRTAAGPG